MSKPHYGLDIAVVGAGIAGLAAAISLSRAGHKVTVYERSEFKNEVGAAIYILPHIVRILRDWGIAEPEPTSGALYHDAAHGKKLHGFRQTDPKTMELVHESTFHGDEQAYGACITTYHRADLHTALRKLAEAGSNIVLGLTAVDIDCTTGTLTVTDTADHATNRTVKADLVVLADGVRSAFVQAVTNQDIPLVQKGISVYRTLIPVANLLNDPEAAMLFSDDGQHFATRTLDPDSGVSLIAYPCRGGDIMNVAIFHQTAPNEQNKHDWNSPANISDASACLEGFHPAYKAILKHAEVVKVYSLADRPPLPTYVNGRVVMIGDAAHPMLPTLAAGAATSFEDAAALGVLLIGLSSSSADELPNRLALFDALRIPRDSMIQVFSKGLLGPKPAIDLADEVRSFYIGHLPEVVIGGSTKETRDFVHSYDVYDVTQTALAWAEKEGYPEDMMLRMQAEGVVKHFGR